MAISGTAMTCLARPLLYGTLVWGALAFALNLMWEIAQLPLYTIVETHSAAQIAYAVLHCTLGDVIIASGSFVLAGFLLHAPGWPSLRPWPGIAIAVVSGLLYTAYSEWNNVYVAGTWAYRRPCRWSSASGLRHCCSGSSFPR